MGWDLFDDSESINTESQTAHIEQTAQTYRKQRTRRPPAVNRAKRGRKPKARSRPDVIDSQLIDNVEQSPEFESFKREHAAQAARTSNGVQQPGYRDYTKIANQYADDVLSGKVVASRFVKLACERHKRDLANQRTADFPYYYSESRAHAGCKTLERLPHIKGRWAREKQKIHLEPWQCFLLCSVFGWLQVADDYRRFRTVYVEVARKNAKSTIAAGIGIHGLGPDNEPGAEVYSCAIQKDQSRIVLDTAREMLRKSPDFLRKYDAEVREHWIVADGTAKKFKALSRDSGKNVVEGENPHIAILDELHLHPTREAHDVLATGMGARDQPLMFMITTAGSNDSGICYEMRGLLIKVLEGVNKLESMFGLIYGIDDDDDWDDETKWIKANPNLGVSVSLSVLRDEANKAKFSPSGLSSFLMRYCCRWVSSSQDWIEPGAWHKCGRDVSIAEFKGAPCILAVDLAATRDLCAVGALFKRGGIYYLFGKCYVPEKTVHVPGKEVYQSWVDGGYLGTVPGETQDHEIIQNDIEQLCADHHVVKIGYDRYQAHNMARRLDKKLKRHKPDEPIVEEIPQARAVFSEPMKMLETLVYDMRVGHDRNPCHSWQLLNTVAERDHKETMRPIKSHGRKKIDMTVAWIMCLTLELRFPLKESRPKRRRRAVYSVPVG